MLDVYKRQVQRTDDTARYILAISKCISDCNCRLADFQIIRTAKLCNPQLGSYFFRNVRKLNRYNCQFIFRIHSLDLCRCNKIIGILRIYGKADI